MGVKRKQPGLSLIERAVIDQQWRRTAIQADIDAVMSDDSAKMVNGAGRVLYVVLTACFSEEADSDSPAIAALVDASQAMYEQAEEAEIPPDRRRRILAGLEVCQFLIPLLDRKSLVDAACDLAVKLRSQHVDWRDFEALLGEVAP